MEKYLNLDLHRYFDDFFFYENVLNILVCQIKWTITTNYSRDKGQWFPAFVLSDPLKVKFTQKGKFTLRSMKSFAIHKTWLRRQGKGVSAFS